MGFYNKNTIDIQTLGVQISMMLSQWEASTKKIPAINASGKAKEKPAVRDLLTAGVVAEEGFEPSQTESESVVLPLHNPAMACRVFNLGNSREQNLL